MPIFFAPIIPLLATGLLYINQPVVNMRECPSHQSKVVSQALYAEQVTVEEERQDWAYIKTPDSYHGWIPKASYVEVQTPYIPSVSVSRLAAHVFHVKDVEYGPLLTLPYEVRLKTSEMPDPRWMHVVLPDGTDGFIQKGDVEREPLLRNKGELSQLSVRFLGLPYTWGGRSSFGYDCSGFVQMLYQKINVHLERDARLQMRDARFQTVSRDQLEPGDLIFFGKSEREITHVGMYLGEDRFIHATTAECQPWIRISHLTDDEWSGNHPRRPYRVLKQLIKTQ